MAVPRVACALNSTETCDSGIARPNAGYATGKPQSGKAGLQISCSHGVSKCNQGSLVAKYSAYPLALNLNCVEVESRLVDRCVINVEHTLPRTKGGVIQPLL